ncbi:MAG: AI-2E family transporter [Bryobacterales bacterium]|nr:AI-2E family transporter [Bryobacterales bacterium]
MAARTPLIFLAILLSLLLPNLLRIAWPFLTPLILASILAIVVNPANQWMIRRIHRPGFATFVTTILATLLVGTIVAVAGFALTRELTAVYHELSQHSLAEGGWPALVAHTVDKVVATMAILLPLDNEAIRKELLDGMGAATGYVLNNLSAAAGGLTSALITGLLTTIFLYFVLRHGSDWIERLVVLIPLDTRTSTSLVRTMYDSVIANVNAVIAVMVGQGLLLGLGFWVAGVRSPALWGTIGGLASIVPVVGSPLVWVPVVVGFVFKGSYWTALFLGLWCALIVGSADNVIRAAVVGARDKQHPVVIALAAIGGVYAFGVMGILLGPLVVSLAAALLKEIRELLPPRWNHQ